jgi:predicted nucleic acid-binding Zn ribbon protein
MSSENRLKRPENPSERYPLMPIIFKCDYCDQNFDNWKEFLNHIEDSSHRVCYKCGQSCGGMINYLKKEYVAIKRINGNIESWKYEHAECPLGNPSKRKEND